MVKGLNNALFMHFLSLPLSAFTLYLQFSFFQLVCSSHIYLVKNHAKIFLWSKSVLTAWVQLTHVIRRRQDFLYSVQHGLPNPILICTNKRTNSLSSVIAKPSHKFSHWPRPHVGLAFPAIMRGWVNCTQLQQNSLIAVMSIQ